MDNLEALECRLFGVNEEIYDSPVICSFREGIACFITGQNYLCIHEEAKHTDVAISRRVEGLNDVVSHIQYLAMHNAIFLASKFNLIILDRNTLKMNIRHKLGTAIIEASWNPMETSLVLISGNHEIYLYSFSGTSFEIKYSSLLYANVPASVYVGWGSENTQFRGLKKTEECRLNDYVQGLVVSGAPKVSWRNNGEQFVVNFQKEGRRFIKVFGCDLEPLHQSEAYCNLGQPVSFMGQGQYIACCAVHNEINEIVIFENNCKVKATFSVPNSKGQIRKLLYHPQMNMLAVHSMDNDDNGYINIYLNSNSRWYLKQQLYYPATRQVKEFEWVNLNGNLNTVCKIVVFTT